jgi:hypothetical protein
MTSNPSAPWQPVKPESLAKQFSRLGWIGFWIQLVLLMIPVLLLIYVLFLSSPESAQRKGIDLSNYLSYGSLLVMIFTTFWFLRYSALGRRIASPESRPARSTVMTTLWTGLWAGCLGIVFSMLQMFNAVGRILFVLLVNPQTGLQMAPTPGKDPRMSLSAIDAVSLTSLLVLGFTIWLLFRSSGTSKEVADDIHLA